MNLRLALISAAIASAGAPALAQHGQHGSTPQPGQHRSTPQPGGHGSAPQPGTHGSTSQPGHQGSTSLPGHQGSTSLPGHQGSTPQPGRHGSTPQSGDHGSVPQPGHHGSAPQASSYAGQQSREIKALSDQEVQGLLTGAGMGFAKSAELNRHPGPMHALEHAAALELTPVQREQLSALLVRHKGRARELGARVVALERELDALFASGKATAAAVDRLAAALGEANGRLRAEHLKTHLETTALLNAVQVARYVEVRGYSADGGGGGTHRH